LLSAIHWLLYSHLFIGICAASITWLTYHLLDLPVSGAPPEVVLAGSGAIIVYILHRHLGMMRLIDVKLPNRYRQMLYIWPTTVGLFILSCLGLLYAFWQIPTKDWATLFIPFILTLGYLLPLFNGKRMRDLPFIKIALVAIVWAWVSVVLPIVRYEIVLLSPKIALVVTERALFIFAITIPFDIRDVAQDIQAGTKTIPSTMRLESSKLLAGIALFIALFIDIVLMSYYHLYSIGVFAGFLFTYVLSLGLIMKTRPDLPDIYFTGLMDGTMLVLVASVLLFERLLQ